MKKAVFVAWGVMALQALPAQGHMTPELLWQVKRISVMGLTPGGDSLAYQVTEPKMAESDFSSTYFALPINGGDASPLTNYQSVLADKTFL